MPPQKGWHNHSMCHWLPKAPQSTLHWPGGVRARWHQNPGPVGDQVRYDWTFGHPHENPRAPVVPSFRRWDWEPGCQEGPAILNLRRYDWSPRESVEHITGPQKVRLDPWGQQWYTPRRPSPSTLTRKTRGGRPTGFWGFHLHLPGSSADTKRFTQKQTY